MIIRTIIGFALALALGGGAYAADTASPQQIAKASAEADKIIKAARVQDLFVNVTDSDVPTVRHLKSGLQCGFEPGSRGNDIHIFEKPFPRGDDISCNTNVLDFTETLYATHMPAGTTLDQAVQAVMADIRNLHPDLEAYKGEIADMTSTPKPGGTPLPLIKTGRFIIKERGKALFSRVAVSMVNGWMVEERVTGPLDKAMDGDVLGGLTMVSTVEQMVEHPPK
jgi:hypothetical protein